MNEIGVKQVAERIHSRLQRYLEAQYHIKDSALIEERRRLLLEPGAISQRPFVEVTPSYAVLDGFGSLNLPEVVKALLIELSGWKPGIGVYPPYKHQADALEAYFSDGEDGSDLIVATGTGSGKTETFLYSVLGALALEGKHRPESFMANGVRALLLYPMNALVSDQTSRLRRMFGDERLSGLFAKRFGRHPRFGMYTSRTPYPGVRNNSKDERHIATLLEYFVGLEESSKEEDRKLVEELKSRGRWPSKDVVRFFAKDQQELRSYQSGAKSGKQYVKRNWDKRLFTQKGDRELLTRHEMQTVPPDLLVTNYSMLEYMLLRPIERSIFRETKAWLEKSPKNQLLLILDEAHMYRGVAGAEVGLLIRRLQSRLGISREKMRCIMTSASLGSGSAAEEAGRVFAAGLTGKRGQRGFAIVRGTSEERSGASAGTEREVAAFEQINPAVFAGVDEGESRKALEQVGGALGWSVLSGNPQQYAARNLTGLGPLELLLKTCAGRATAFETLTATLFPGFPQSRAERATDGLLALGSYARRFEKGREEQPLLPTRVHMLFRGLPSIHACMNEVCSKRRFQPGEKALLGRLFTEPRTHCECGARVFEIYTHRDCGVAFLRAFGLERTTGFLWNERGGKLTEFGSPLHEIHFLLEEPHPDMVRDVEPVWLDIATGRVFDSFPGNGPGFRLMYRPTSDDEEEGASTFGSCPVCTRRTKTGGTFKIMDLATKGEQPFANLVREQFANQVATKPLDEVHPNEGRKALLFSDGRQKAARLARDLPREVERDSMREALIAAIAALREMNQEVVADDALYAAFVSVCARHHLHFFDDKDGSVLLEECQRLVRDYELDLSFALSDGWKPTPPVRYRQALLRQISDPYYSLVAACAVSVEARKSKLRLLEKRLSGRIPSHVEIAEAWIEEMLGASAFDPGLSYTGRIQEFPFFTPIRQEDGVKGFFEKVASRASLDAEQTLLLRTELFDLFTRPSSGVDDSGRLLATDGIVLRIAIDETWLQCQFCGHVQLKPFLGACAVCGKKDLEGRPPDHPYMTARKGFFREPLRAVLRGERPVHITAEEHTAQLSQRDAGVVYATTEEFELRFQDVPLGKDKPPVDVLSCTTTMEVGIDIGSLTAVGLRTVPPLRENYQQRAGRAGRRGTSVSSVVTFAQGGAHDAHYFANPQTMISGDAREPRIKSDNRRLARRHVYSYLLQTFFHGQMDRLPVSEQRVLAANRPDLMSAFGAASDFFVEDGDFTFGAFEKWLLGSRKAVTRDIASWLPKELFGDPREAEEFVRGLAEDLLSELKALGAEIEAKEKEAEKEEHEGEEGETAVTLLDLLFDKGLLPSYAFPTDLCSFVIQEYAEHGRIIEKERPQLAKSQALSEYAPGRLLVVNKLTYRVGGIFIDGPPTATPADGLFGGVRNRYIGCRRCSYVRLDETTDVEAALKDPVCPVCSEELHANELLDPPGFSPEGGTRLKEGDREQDITYASSAQLPELVHRDFEWRTVEGARLGYAYAEGVKLIVTNKGKDNAGFAVCESCGASWLSDDPESQKPHLRPFLLPRYVVKREQPPKHCNGVIRRELFLGHQFRTDILLLRIEFQKGMDFSPSQPWLYDALSTCAEAMALGASLALSIDPGELSAGFRLVPPSEDGIGAAEIYLFDTASGGAGYAYEVGLHLDQMLDQVETLLTTCPGGCERSCTKCLRHYGNRFLHPRLDRRLGLQLVRYARFGELPGIPSVESQRRTLEPLGRFLRLEGWSVSNDSGPLTAVPRGGGAAVSVAVYPALLAGAEAKKRSTQGATVLLPDYLVEQDLPSAYQEVLKHI